MKNNNLRALARGIYHRLPLPQRMKWRLRERLHPLLVTMQISPSLGALAKGTFQAIRHDQSTSALNRDSDREEALSRIVQNLGTHASAHGPVSHWIALPFLATGGAEMVALNLSRALRQLRPDQSVALLITDRKLVSERMVIPEGVLLVVFDDYLGEDRSYSRKQALLRELLIAVRPERFHNINSEVAWHLILAEGERLKRMVKLYASIFAFQFAPDGQTKTGYAAYFLKDGMPHLSGLISDNQRFIDDAIVEYGFGEAERSRMWAVYQPCRLSGPEAPNPLSPHSRHTGGEECAKRPQVLWAGRLDAEKRVDLFLDVVRQCAFADFHVFGQVVLDGDAALPPLPNLSYEGPFTSPCQWTERHRFDAFLFTSKWEGMPNILIEVGALGIPVIAPTVGGVGELITRQTGYPLPERPSVHDYAAALNDIAADPQEAHRRSECLKDLIERRHSWPAFVTAVASLPGYGTERPAAETPGASDAHLPITKEPNAAEPPVVSVIIPCYNQGRYLHECVTSVLTACHAHMEIIVVDDGSTDSKTQRHLDEVVQLAPELVRVHRQRNQGLSGARNSGLELAKGEFVQFLDADDVLVPCKIDTQLAQLTANPQLDVSVCNFLLCDEARNTYSKHDEAIAQFDLTLDDFLYRWERGFAIPIHCGLFRRRIIRGSSFDTHARAKEDWLFWTGLALADVRFGYIHGHWAIYRQHDSSMRRSYLNMGRAWLQAGLKIDAMLSGREPLFFESVVAWFEQCYRTNPGYRAEIAELQSGGLNHLDGSGAKSESGLTPVIPAHTEIASDRLLTQLSAITRFRQPPLISVIVPIYGHYEYLEACLLSIANQGDVSIEIVCIDDASPDPRVSRLMHVLGNKMDRLKVIVSPTNRGISDSQNAAVSIASGEYVAFLDCDDALNPEALSVIRAQIEARPDVDYFFTDRHDIDERGELVRTARYGGYESLRFSNQDNIRTDLLDGMVASHLKVIRRSAYLEGGGCNAKFSGVQDWDLALRIAEKGKLHYVNQPLYRHRVHRASVTRSDVVTQFRKTNLVRRHYSERWLRRLDSSTSQAEKRFSKDNLPIELAALRESWRTGHRCVADATGTLHVSQINFLREFNSYFDKIEWNDPAVPASLAGYLWNPHIV